MTVWTVLVSQRQNETQGLFDPCACTSQDEYCTTELCLSVEKAEEEKNKQQRRQQQGRDCVSVPLSMSMYCTICHMLKLKELTPLLNCRRLLQAVSCRHGSSSFVPPSAVPTFVPPAISRKRSPNFFASALVRSPSRCFVKRSAVLFFVSTRLTNRRFSRIHCCIDTHRISRNFVVKFLEEFCESQQFSGANTGCVEQSFTRTETDCSLLQTSVAHRYVLYIAMISRNTLARCWIAGPIWVTTTNEFQQTCMKHFARFKTKTSVLRAFETSYQLFHCALALCCLVWIIVKWRIFCLVSKMPWRWVFRRLCESWSNDDHPEGCWRELHHSRTSTRIWLLVSSFPTSKDSTRSALFFTSKPLRVLVISRPKKLTVSPWWRNTTTSVKYRLVFMCSKSLMRCSSGHVPRHPCDAGGSNLLIVVRVSSHTSKDLMWTGSSSCRWLSVCFTFGHAPIWLLLRQRRACPSSWSQAPSWRVWLQKGCLFPQGSTLSAEGLHPPCTRNQTEVEVQSFERTNTTATGLHEELCCWHMYPTADCF